MSDQPMFCDYCDEPLHLEHASFCIVAPLASLHEIAKAAKDHHANETDETYDALGQAITAYEAKYGEIK